MRIVVSLDALKSVVEGLEDLGVCTREDVKVGLADANVDVFVGKYGAKMISIDTGSSKADIDELFDEDPEEQEVPSDPFEDQA